MTVADIGWLALWAATLAVSILTILDVAEVLSGQDEIGRPHFIGAAITALLWAILVVFWFN